MEKVEESSYGDVNGLEFGVGRCVFVFAVDLECGIQMGSNRERIVYAESGVLRSGGEKVYVGGREVVGTLRAHYNRTSTRVVRRLFVTRTTCPTRKQILLFNMHRRGSTSPSGNLRFL